MFPKVTLELTLKDKEGLNGLTVSGYSTLLTVGTVSEGHTIVKDKCIVENVPYLICLEHRAGSGDGTKHAKVRCSNSIL